MVWWGALCLWGWLPMDYNFTHSVPAGTLESAPSRLALPLEVGIIVQVRVGIPDGAADEVHVVIERGLHQLWPSRSGDNYAWNDYVYEIQESYVLDEVPYELTLVTWNDDTVNDHQVMVGFNMLPLEPTRLSKFVQAVLGRPARW